MFCIKLFLYSHLYFCFYSTLWLFLCRLSSITLYQYNICHHNDTLISHKHSNVFWMPLLSNFLQISVFKVGNWNIFFLSISVPPPSLFCKLQKNCNFVHNFARKFLSKITCNLGKCVLRGWGIFYRVLSVFLVKFFQIFSA